MERMEDREQKEDIERKLAYLCRAFRLEGDIVRYRLIPNGHINTTYYVALYDGREMHQYLVQKVNWYVFKDPVSMMHNIDLITQHIMNQERTQERRRRLHFHHTADGNNYIWLGSGPTKEFWRVSNFVENSVSFESADGNGMVLEMAGRAFGRFERQLQDFDATQLVESIPHFHDTRFRLNTLSQDAKADEVGRVCLVQSELEEIGASRDFACTLCEMIDRKEVPIRVTHNDTKTNNVLLDKKTLDPLVIIDLDTCMPGLACYDFGDTIRFAACTGAEDEMDVAKMKLDMNLFRSFAKGYIGEASGFLTDRELDTMATGAAVITLELASRFLDDFITGDKYFRIDYPNHNLVRARAQLALYRDMRLHLDEMNQIVHEVAGR